MSNHTTNHKKLQGYKQGFTTMTDKEIEKQLADQLAELTRAVEKVTTAVSCTVSEMLSPKEVAALTGLSRAKIRELEKSGWLRRHWPNAKKCYRKADVDACMRGIANG